MLALFSVIFAGCNAQNPSATAAPTAYQQATNAPVSNDTQQGGPITIISPYFYEGTYDSTSSDESTLYLEELLKTNGFDVTFERVYYNLDSPTAYEEYFSYLSSALYKDNTLAFVPGYKKDILPAYVNLADLSSQIETSAPSYYGYASRNAIIYANNQGTIVSSLSSIDNLSTVFVLNVIAGEYTDNLDSSQDYLTFINWAQKRNKSLRPSVIMTFQDDLTATSNILYDIFLPQQGFVPLGGYFEQTYSLCVDAKKPQSVYDTSAMGFYEDMLENIETYANYSKIVVKHENAGKKNFSEYSSVIMPLEDMSYYASIADYNFYPLNYTMEILNPDMQLNPTYKNTYIAAAENTNQSESLRLLNWIYSDVSNYLSVKYGEVGVDYAFDQNNYLYLTEAGNQYVQSSPIANMINNLEFESTLNAVPANYLEEINSIQYVKNDNLARQYENYQRLITVDSYIYDAQNRLIRRWESSVRTLELTTERKVNYESGLITFDAIDDLIAEIAK